MKIFKVGKNNADELLGLLNVKKAQVVYDLTLNEDGSPIEPQKSKLTDMVAMTPRAKVLYDNIQKERQEALDDFGAYTWGDRGADEVIDLKSIVKRLSKLSVSEIATIIVNLNYSVKLDEDKYEFADDLAEQLTGYLEEYDFFDDLLKEPYMDEINF